VSNIPPATSLGGSATPGTGSSSTASPGSTPPAVNTSTTSLASGKGIFDEFAKWEWILIAVAVVIVLLVVLAAIR